MADPTEKADSVYKPVSVVHPGDTERVTEGAGSDPGPGGEFECAWHSPPGGDGEYTLDLYLNLTLNVEVEASINGLGRWEGPVDEFGLGGEPVGVPATLPPGDEARPVPMVHQRRPRVPAADPAAFEILGQAEVVVADPVAVAHQQHLLDHGRFQDDSRTPVDLLPHQPRSILHMPGTAARIDVPAYKTTGDDFRYIGEGSGEDSGEPVAQDRIILDDTAVFRTRIRQCHPRTPARIPPVALLIPGDTGFQRFLEVRARAPSVDGWAMI